MKRILLLFVTVIVISVILTIFINIGAGLLLLTLLHALFTSVVLKPRIGEFLTNRSMPQEGKEKLNTIGSSIHYRLYWVVSNLVFFTLSIVVILHNISLISIFKHQL